MKRKARMKGKKHAGFTLLEMLIVLFVIALLVLLFVPNLSKQRAKIEEQSKGAIEKVVETQVELYRLDYGSGNVTWEQLTAKGYLTAKQVEEAKKRGVTLE